MRVICLVYRYNCRRVPFLCPVYLLFPVIIVFVLFRASVDMSFHAPKVGVVLSTPATLHVGRPTRHVARSIFCCFYLHLTLTPEPL